VKYFPSWKLAGGATAAAAAAGVSERFLRLVDVEEQAFVKVCTFSLQMVV